MKLRIKTLLPIDAILRRGNYAPPVFVPTRTIMTKEWDESKDALHMPPGRWESRAYEAEDILARVDYLISIKAYAAAQRVIGFHLSKVGHPSVTKNEEERATQ